MDVFTHLVLGFVMYHLLNLALPVELVFFAFIIANWIPDIDHIGGFLFKNFISKWNLSEERMSQFQRIAYYPRTFLHSFWGSLAFFGLFWLVSGSFIVGLSAFLGTLVHLVLDSFDRCGVKWFYPWVHITGKIPVTYLPKQERIGMTRLLKYTLRLNAAILAGIVIFKFLL